MKPSILILSISDASTDPRVYKQVKALCEDYTVYVAGLGSPQVEGVTFCPILSRSAKSIFEKIYKALFCLLGDYGPYLKLRYWIENQDKLANTKFACIILNDIEAFYLAEKYAQKAPLIFDAHEYYPCVLDNSLAWRIFHKFAVTRLCKKIISTCSEVMTVAPTIAAKYHSKFGKNPTLVMNMPYYQNLQPTKVSKNVIKMVHHGGAAPARHLERMIEMMDHLDERFTLDLYLVGKSSYINKLYKMAAKRKNIAWKSPVPMQTLPTVLNSYDLGVFLVPPTTFNLKHCLPNKFFEFIQARLGIAIGPSPEMADLVRQHDLGIVSETFEVKNFAEKLNALTAEEITRFKQNADNSAHLYCAERTDEIIQKMVARTLS